MLANARLKILIYIWQQNFVDASAFQINANI